MTDTEKKEKKKEYMKIYRENNKIKIKEYQKEYDKKYSLENKEKQNQKSKKYYQNNKEKVIEYKKKYYQNNKEELSEKQKKYQKINRKQISEQQKKYQKINKQQISEQQKEYYKINKEEIKEYQKNNIEKINKQRNKYLTNRRETDSLFKLKGSIRNRILKSIKNNGYTKKSKTFEILGCECKDFKQHIERQFTLGMKWENQGDWHLDHIIPISLAKDELDMIKLNHYTNFQPMWALENIIKGNKVIPNTQIKLI